MMANPTTGWDDVPVYGFYFAGGDTPDVGTIQLQVTQRVTRVDGRRIYAEGATVTRIIGQVGTDTATRDAVRAAWRAKDQDDVETAGGTFDGAAWDAWWAVQLTGAVFASFPASDDPDIVEQGYEITVVERLKSGGGRTYPIKVLLADLNSTPPGVNLGLLAVPPGSAYNPAPIYQKGQPGGVAALDADGDVTDATGAKISSPDLSNYATVTTVTQGLATKVNSSTYTSGLQGKADLTGGVVPDEELPTRLSDSALTAAIATHATATNVLTLGVKGDVVTVTDAAITSGQTALHSTSAAFTSADVGKRVQVVGAGVAWNARGAWTAGATYAAGDSVTLDGTTYVAGFAETSPDEFEVDNWTLMPDDMARTLFATITAVSGGVATLDTAAGTTVTGATCTYGTDDSATVSGLGAGDYYFPGERTYFLADWYMPSDTSARFGPHSVVKLPSYTSTDAAPLRMLTSDRGSTGSVVNVHLRGVVTIDMTELTPLPGTNPRGVHVLNAQDCSVETVIGIGIPGPTGNVVQTGANSGGAGTERFTAKHVHNAQIRGLGSSGVQHTGGVDCDYGMVTSEGGVGFRCEMDGNATSTDNVRVGVVHNTGESIFANSAVTLTAHGHVIRGVAVGSILAEGGADGLSLAYGAGGSVVDCTISRMRVSGGGRGTNIPANNLSFPGVVVKDAMVDGASGTANRDLSGSLAGVGFALAPGMTLYSPRAIGCQAGGFKDTFQGGTVPAQSRVTLYDAQAFGNTGNGLYARATERIVLYGGKFGDDPAFETPTVAQLLRSNEYTDTLAGWTAITGASGVSGTGGTLTVTASGTNTEVDARTSTSTGGVPVTPGTAYKFIATASLGTAPDGSQVRLSIWFSRSDGSAITPVNPGSPAIAVGAGTPVTTSFALEAPDEAAYAAVVLKWFAPVVGDTPTAGQTMTFADLALQELAGVPAQSYGLRADTGCTLDQYSTDTRHNGSGATVGSGTIRDLSADPEPSAPAAGDWVPLTLATGVASQRGGYETVAARLEGDVVRLKGQLTFDTAYTSGTTIFTMPTEMLPSASVAPATRHQTGATTLFINPTTGAAGFTSSAANTQWGALDGVTYTR